MENTSTKREPILEQMRNKRKELLGLVSIYGFKDTKVLKCSQELDLLIYQIQILDQQSVKENMKFYLECEEMNRGHIEKCETYHPSVV